MYEQLSELMSQSSFFYGPMTKEQAFDIPTQSWATAIGNNWYAGTTQPVEALSALNVPRPAYLDEPIDADVKVEETTESPSA